MGDEQTAFMRSICADPADDTVRLAFADWLNERGGDGDDARAEFIRVQVELEQIRFATIGNQIFRQQELNERESQLFGDGKTLWPTAVAIAKVFGKSIYNLTMADNGEDTDSVHWTWNRGFVSHVTCTAADWLAHADALVWHPAQTVECGRCGDLSGFERDIRSECPDCDGTSGTSRTSRPFPATAQPITDVTLTDPPTEGDLRRLLTRLTVAELGDLSRRYIAADNRGKMILETVWKGIIFDVPVPAPPAPSEDGTDPYGGFLVPAQFTPHVLAGHVHVTQELL